MHRKLQNLVGPQIIETFVVGLNFETGRRQLHLLLLIALQVVNEALLPPRQKRFLATRLFKHNVLCILGDLGQDLPMRRLQADVQSTGAAVVVGRSGRAHSDEAFGWFGLARFSKCESAKLEIATVLVDALFRVEKV